MMRRISAILFLLIHILLKNADAYRNTSLLCLIHTATPSHETRAHTILRTWAPRCDEFLFFTDSQMSPEIPHVYWPELHTRDHSWEKIRKVFNYVAEKYPRKFDWYLRADDDAYIVVDNLRAFLSKHSPNVPHYFGYRWNYFSEQGYADGGAYVLSKPTVEAFNRVMKNNELCPDFHRAEEDQEISKCLAAVGIYPEDTRDENGSERFHHFHPTEQLEMYNDAFARRFAYYTPLKGVKNFSPSMISFHHISPYEMRILDYVFYKFKRRKPTSFALK
ncbi:unnamed protein product, partial [Mesorhabditis belari]|uniref:N-acetylgalactosaminide beta-1,3-galactosyltransferase n=1 Tax=Mesorhabditis belari TaxID=2138241 RepID=A0AAF3JA49_9BILA